MKKRSLVLGVALTWVLGAGAQQTLQWCLEQGLKNNLSIHIAENRKQTAEENATHANAGMLPNVTASAGYGLDLTSTRAKERVTGQTNTHSNNFEHSVHAQLGLTWTAFDGFGMQARYEQLKLLRQVGNLERETAAKNLIASITAEYYNCIQQRIRLRNYRNAVRLSRERMRIVEARYNIGNFSRLDYMQAKVDFNADSAQYMKQQEALRTSFIELNRLINLPSENSENSETSKAPASPTPSQRSAPSQRLHLADTLIAVVPVLDYDALWEDVLAYNDDLRKSKLDANIAQQTLRSVLSRDYPSVKLNASYGYNYNRYDVSAANRWGDRWGPSAGITVGYQLFDGTRHSAKRAARREVENARMQTEDLQLTLKAQFSTLSQSHQNNLQILALEEQNVVTAQENYEIARERYMLGDLSGFEMREAQQSLLNAEERILKAAYDTKMCEISLMVISGGVEKYLIE